MPIDVSALVHYVPQFVVAAIASGYFFATFSKRLPGSYAGLEFTLGKSYKRDTGKIQAQSEKKSKESSEKVGSVSSHSFNSLRSSQFIPPKKIVSKLDSLLPDAQLIILTITLWILISVLLSPASEIGIFELSGPILASFLAYLVLSALTGVALLTTVISRINITKPILLFLILLAGVLTYVSFYSPSLTSGIFFYGIFRILIISASVVLACIFAYLASSRIRNGTAFSLSAYTTFASYGITAFIIVFNFLNIFR